MNHAFEMSLGGERIRLQMIDNIYQFRYTWECNRHNHANFELHIILRGACSIDVENDKFVLHERQAIIIAPGQYHRPMPAPGEIERFSVSFSMEEGKLLNALRSVVGASKIYNITPEIEAICCSLFYESAAGNAFRRDMLQVLLTNLMICNFRQLKLADNAKSALPLISDSERVSLIDTYFEVHLADKASAEALAAELHLSRRQLARVLQQNYGMGFREKLFRTRMDRAAWMLLQTEKRVMEIAAEVGYDSEAAFYQAFRTRFSMTPIQYRSMLKQNSDERSFRTL